MERKLPNELTDVIINFFWDDPPTMRSCALTCRDWLPRSVFHFQAYLILSIKSVATLSLLSQRLGCPNSRQFYRDMEVMEVSEVFTQIHFAHTVPLHIPGPFLPKLREIEFSHLGRRLGESPPMHWHHSSFTLLSSYKAMTTLRLSNCHFHDAGNLRRVVYALPALDDVTLVDVTFSPRTSLSPELGRRRRQLDRLALRLSGPTVYYGLIYCLCLWSELRELTTYAEHAITALPRTLADMRLAHFALGSLAHLSTSARTLHQHWLAGPPNAISRCYKPGAQHSRQNHYLHLFHRQRLHRSTRDHSKNCRHALSGRRQERPHRTAHLSPPRAKPPAVSREFHRAFMAATVDPSAGDDARCAAERTHNRVGHPR